MIPHPTIFRPRFSPYFRMHMFPTRPALRNGLTYPTALRIYISLKLCVRKKTSVYPIGARRQALDRSPDPESCTLIIMPGIVQDLVHVQGSAILATQTQDRERLCRGPNVDALLAYRVKGSQA
jgi:hypothetical protein